MNKKFKDLKIPVAAGATHHKLSVLRDGLHAPESSRRQTGSPNANPIWELRLDLPACDACSYKKITTHTGRPASFVCREVQANGNSALCWGRLPAIAASAPNV